MPRKSKQPDIRKVRRALRLESEGIFTAQQIADDIGRSHRQTQNYLSQKWRAERGLEYLNMAPLAGKGESVGLEWQLAAIHRRRRCWSRALRALKELQGIDLFTIEPSELQNWLCRKEAIWPVPMGRGRLDSNGRVTVTLFLENHREWRHLRQHMGVDHGVWGVIEAGKQAMGADVSARIGLYRWVESYIQKELRLPGALHEDQVSIEDDDGASVHINYLNELYSQVFRRVTDLPFGAVEEDQFDNFGQGCLLLGPDRQILLGGSVAQEQRAVKLLVEEQWKLVNRPEAKLVGKCYLEAGRKFEDLKVAITLVRNSPPGNSCDRCGR